MGKQLAFYFEQKHCTGCMTCQIACKDKNDLGVGQLFRKVSEVAGGDVQEEGFAIIPEVYAFCLSISCNHCSSPVCAASCPVGAIQKRVEDGIVYIDQELCVGCLKCARSCPYNAPQYNLKTKKVDKCDFCRDLLAEGKTPACVSACPMRVLNYGLLDTLQAEYGKINHTKGLPEGDITQPSLVITPHRHAINNKPQAKGLD